ncbi:MAG: glycosyltransferase family 2 protein [Burkholderiales bacterium]|nr:glycosyltransferase family 2 protein [Burkholderiales bacterium]
MISFSIVICNYNYGRFVGEAIASCLEQRYPPRLFEVIVVDDGSTDDSRQIIDTLARDSRVVPIFQPNLGQGAAFAAGVARARGAMVCLLDSDDTFHPDKLGALAAWVASNQPLPDAIFLCHDLAVHDVVSGACVEASWFKLRGLSMLGPVLKVKDAPGSFAFSIPCGQVYTRTLLNRICDALPVSEWRLAVDAAIARAAVLLAGEVHFLPIVLGTYRVHGANDSASILDGRFRYRRPNRADDGPRKLRFLESFVDTLALDARERAEAISYVKRLEISPGTRHASTGLALRNPTATFVVLDSSARGSLRQTIESLGRHDPDYAVEVIVVSDDLASVEEAIRGASNQPTVLRSNRSASRFERMQRGFRAGRGEFVTFIRPGDLLHEQYLDQHLYVHRGEALAAMSCCDIRVVQPDGAVVYDRVFGGRNGVWHGGGGFLPALDGGLTGWIYPPMSANLLRRSNLLALLFERNAPDVAGIIAATPEWFLCQFARALGGVVRITEPLVTRKLELGEQAFLPDIASPRNDRDCPVVPDFSAAARVLLGLVCRNLRLFESSFPEPWFDQFAAWLGCGQDRVTIAKLQEIAATGGAAWLVPAFES